MPVELQISWPSCYISMSVARGPDLALRGLADICRKALALACLPLAAGGSRFLLSTRDRIESMHKSER